MTKPYEYVTDLFQKIHSDISEIKHKLFTEKPKLESAKRPAEYSIDAVQTSPDADKETAVTQSTMIRARLNLPETIRVKAETEERTKPWNHDRNFLLQILTVAVVAVYTFVALLQWMIMRDALTVEQRPFLKIQQKIGSSNQLIAGQPIQTTLEFINTGKTPARHMKAYMFIELVSANQSPHLINPDKPGDETRYWSFTTTGVIFNAQSIEGVAKRTGPDPGGPNNGTKDIPLTIPETEKLSRGDIYEAVYGVTYYWDIFGNKHWTAFCGWAAAPSGGYAASECTRYNDVDGK